MTFFVGHNGMVRLRRSSLENTDLPISVTASDVNTTLNRLYFIGSEENIITGDQLFISTEDSQGLVFFSESAWPGSGQVQQFLRVYVNVNAVGGVRFYNAFVDAINNNRDNELALSADFAGTIQATIAVRDSRYNTLGSVVSYDINTDRGAIETTSLSDKFRQQYSAGLISGSGSIECLFDYQTIADEEAPLFLLQTIQRLDVGSELSVLLSLAGSQDNSRIFAASSNEVFYEVQAVITRAGVTVRSDALISCSIDFLTTGEFRAKIGVPSEYLLKEDLDLIQTEANQETGLGFLLQEVVD